MSPSRVLFALVVLAAVVAWSQRAELQSWWTSASATSGSGAPVQAGSFKPGELRKCVLGPQVTYANTDCPKGATAQAVTGGAVTVVPGTPVAKPSAAGSGPSSLHKALDITRDDTLRDKIMERQMEGAR